MSSESSSARERKNASNRANIVKVRAQFETGERKRAKQKRCPLCERTKAANQFYLSNSNPDGLHGWCKECSDKRTVENGRKRLFGITPEGFEAMLVKQEHRCAICRTKEQGAKAFSVDHDHATGKVRALLCTRCNLLLGGVNDEIDILKAAIVYLETYSPKPKSG